MTTKKLTIKDIARELEVSITTISFVINGMGEQKNISKKLIEKILAYVKNNGFHPNSLAKGLRTGKSQTIAFLADKISEPFYSQISHFIDSKAGKYGYKIMCSSTGGDAGKARELINSYKHRHIDGFIIAPFPSMEPLVQELKIQQIPVVLFDSYFPSLECDHVITDNFNGTFQGTTHLLDNGYRSIVFITIKSNEIQMLQRLDGYLEAMQSKGLESHILELTYTSPEKCRQDIDDFIRKNKAIDALFFAANYLCIEGIRVVKSAKLHTKEISILCFDDFDILSFCTPSISAIAQSPEEIADNILSLMMYRLREKSVMTPCRHLTVPTRLLVRESTGPTNNLHESQHIQLPYSK